MIKLSAKGKKSKNKLVKPFVFHKDAKKWGEERAKALGISEEEFWEGAMADADYALVEFSEATGKATLKVYDFSKLVTEQAKGEKIYEIYKDLRDNFAPVAAGIEYHKSFMVGSGFNIVIDNPRDKHELEMQKETINLCKNIYQDYYNKGLDKILYIMTDTALTVGAAAAEIIYGKEINFNDFATITTRQGPDGKPVQVITTEEPTSAQWKSLKGIKKLKIIKSAITRLKPVFDNLTYEILYWTLDEPKGTTIQKSAVKQKEPRKLLPWQVLWISWNTRETELIGQSIVKPVVSIAKIVRTIHTNVGEGFYRWANRKYFFIAGSERRPWSKIAQGNFLKLLEQMVKNNWTGIPVPQGFDVKEIGGEVFQGRQILDHFISMIAAGMNYPRDFLEFGRTRAGDKAWLAWQVKYGSAQRQVRRAIEQQLFEKHLWSKFGKTYRVPKQGVPKRAREKREIYIPKIRWKAEGRWQQAEELKNLQGWLNVANPIGPEFKLGVEKRAAELLGLGEIEFPTFSQLRREMKAQAKMMEEQMKAKAKAPKGFPPKKPPTKEEQLKARQAGGVSKQKAETGKPSKKGKAKTQGGTRQPKLIKKKFVEAEEKIAIEEEIKKAVGDAISVMKLPAIPLDIRVKSEPAEPTKVDVTIKSKSENLDVEVSEEKVKTEKEKQETEKERREALKKIKEKAEKL